MYRRSQFLVRSASRFGHHADPNLLVAVVANTRTGQIHILDAETVDELFGETSTLQTSASLDALVAAGLVVDRSTDELAEILRENTEAALTTRSLQITVMPTAFCNLGCGYCGQEHSVNRFTRQDEALTVQRIVRRATSSGSTHVNLTWFGGEPIAGIASIERIAQDLHPLLEEAGIAHTSMIVTNGTLLTPANYRRLVASGITRFEITIDGPEEHHNTTRPSKLGPRSSYRAIINNLQQIFADPQSEHSHFSIRTNVGESLRDSAAAFAQTMIAAGFSGRKNVSFYPATIHPWGNDVSSFEISSEEYAQVQRSWLHTYHETGLQRLGRPPLQRKHIACVAVSRGEVIAPDGQVFSCTEQPLVPGQHETEGLATLIALPDLSAPREPGKFAGWNAEVAREDSSVGCGRCPILPVCGGGCPKSWMEGRPACPPLKFNLPHRLDDYAVHALSLSVRGPAREREPARA